MERKSAQSDFVTTGTVARALGITVNTVKNWIRGGKIQGIRLPSGHYRVPAAELDRLTRGAPVPDLAGRREEAWQRYELWRRQQAVEKIKPEDGSWPDSRGLLRRESRQVTLLARSNESSVVK